MWVNFQQSVVVVTRPRPGWFEKTLQFAMNTDYENRPITDKYVTNMTWVEFTRPKGANQEPALGSDHSTCYSLVNLVTDALKKKLQFKKYNIKLQWNVPRN